MEKLEVDVPAKNKTPHLLCMLNPGDFLNDVGNHVKMVSDHSMMQ